MAKKMVPHGETQKLPIGKLLRLPSFVSTSNTIRLSSLSSDTKEYQTYVLTNSQVHRHCPDLQLVS